MCLSYLITLVFLLHENLKLGLNKGQSALLARQSMSACRGRQRYFKLKRDSYELSAVNIEEMLQPLPGDLLVGFIECTQFVPGS